MMKMIGFFATCYAVQLIILRNGSISEATSSAGTAVLTLWFSWHLFSFLNKQLIQKVFLPKIDVGGKCIFITGELHVN